MITLQSHSQIKLERLVPNLAGFRRLFQDQCNLGLGGGLRGHLPGQVAGEAVLLCVGDGGGVEGCVWGEGSGWTHRHLERRMKHSTTKSFGRVEMREKECYIVTKKIESYLNRTGSELRPADLQATGNGLNASKSGVRSDAQHLVRGLVAGDAATMQVNRGGVARGVVREHHTVQRVERGLAGHHGRGGDAGSRSHEEGIGNADGRQGEDEAELEHGCWLLWLCGCGWRTQVLVKRPQYRAGLDLVVVVVVDSFSSNRC